MRAYVLHVLVPCLVDAVRQRDERDEDDQDLSWKAGGGWQCLAKDARPSPLPPSSFLTHPEVAEALADGRPPHDRRNPTRRRPLGMRGMGWIVVLSFTLYLHLRPLDTTS